MNPFSTPDAIFISKHPQDMRAGVQRLASTITLDLARDPADGALYVFVSRDAKKAKMLKFDTNGWCLYYCTMCKGTFRWLHASNATDPLLVIERRQLVWLLEGLAIEQPKAAKPITARTVI